MTKRRRRRKRRKRKQERKDHKDEKAAVHNCMARRSRGRRSTKRYQKATA